METIGRDTMELYLNILVLYTDVNEESAHEAPLINFVYVMYVKYAL